MQGHSNAGLGAMHWRIARQHIFYLHGNTKSEKHLLHTDIDMDMDIEK